jgi:hypothetical protein
MVKLYPKITDSIFLRIQLFKRNYIHSLILNYFLKKKDFIINFQDNMIKDYLNFLQ